MHGRRLIAPALAFALAAALPIEVLAAPAAPKSSCPLSVIPRDSGWTQINPPAWDPSVDALAGPDEFVGMVDFAVASAPPHPIFVANREQVLRSTDGGCTWEKVYQTPTSDTQLVECVANWESTGASPPGCLNIYDLAITNGPDPTVYIQLSFFTAGERFTLLLASSDLGKTWHRILSPNGAGFVFGDGPLQIAPSDPNKLYVYRPMYNLLYVSDDAGANWEARRTPEFYAGVHDEIAIDPSDPDQIWVSSTTNDPALTSGPNMEQLFRSRDAGRSWEIVDNPVSHSDDRHFKAIALHSEAGRPPTVVVANRFVHLSEDGGQTWPTYFQPGGNTGAAKTVFGAGGSFLFVVLDHSNEVIRIDLRTRKVTAIKSRSYAPDGSVEDSGFGPVQYIPGHGLYISGQCAQLACAAIYRYRGKGI